MSIRLDYRVDDAWKTESRKLNFRELTRFDFETRVMPGDQLIEIDGKDFSYRGWSIPLLNLPEVSYYPFVSLKTVRRRPRVIPLTLARRSTLPT